MEGNIDSRERDSRRPALEFDVTFRLLLLARGFVALVDNRVEHLLDFLDRERFRELKTLVSKTNSSSCR
jgi:hypothetical protein